VCAYCDAIIVTEEHTEGEIFEVEATTESAGGKFYICPVCGGTVTVEVYEQLTGSDGDINMDGAVDISDVTDLLKYLAGTSELVGNGDIDGSDVIDITDVTELLKILAGN
jgi:hypothetical protein